MNQTGSSTDGPTVTHQTSVRIVAVKHLTEVSCLLRDFYKAAEMHRIEIFASCEQRPGNST